MSTPTATTAEGTGTLTLSVSSKGELHFKLEKGETWIAVKLTPDEARNLGKDFFAAAARADLNGEESGVPAPVDPDEPTEDMGQ